ncbi:MAG: hypothetical protein ABSG63_13815, partial [Spirochaetia bacterium]
PFHPEGFGMVGFADSSRNDATLMTYQLSGTLAYWDIGTGNEIKEMPTAGGLVNVRTSDDRSSLVGQSGPEVIGIDAVSGETRFRTDATGIVSMDISGDARKVACLFADGSLQLRDTVSNAESAPQATGTFAWRPRLVRLTPDAILLAGDAGGIGTLSGDGRTTDFTRDILAQVSSMAARDGALALAAGDVIHIFLIGGRRPATSPVTESFSVANPFPGPVGLVFLGQQKLAVWKQGDSAGSISVIDLSTRRIIGSAISFDGALAAVAAQDDQLFVLEKSGEVVVLNPETGEQFFKARWPGADCVAPFGPSSLVLGGLSGGDIGGSLVRIDLRSGETVPLPGSSTITFALAADPAGKALYFLGVSPDDQTTLTRYEGTGLQRATVVDSAEGEFLSTSLSIDPVKDYLYTSLGREEIKAWTGKAMQRLAESARATLALAIMQGLLVSLERDSSVSLWDTAADQAVGQIYPFADGSWAAVMTDGTILGSLDGREKVGNSGSIIEKGRRESDSRSPSGEIPYSMMTDRGGP